MNYVTSDDNLTVRCCDTNSVFSFTLLNINRAPVTLTGASVKVNARDRKGNVVTFDAIIKDATGGKIEFNFVEDDTILETGTLDVEFQVTYQNGRIETFPVNGYLKFKVTQNLKHRR